MRKVAHVIKLDQVVFMKDDDGKMLRVLNLYIDEDGAECGGLVMYEDGKIMSWDSNIWEEQCYGYDGESNWPFVPKSELRDEKLKDLLGE
jgi:hypothetical protein